jgi:predicted tellurium resistance membrane protein TerC
MDGDTGSFLLQLLQIIWINILLSGDNAVVIALACRGLPPKSRRRGVVLGAGVAIVLRIIFTLMVVWQAVRIVAIADMVMSLDNVIAIAAVAKDSTLLVILGLGLSVPLIVFGAQLVITMIERFPWMVWVGAALLGFVAGELMVSEPRLHGMFGPWSETTLEMIGGALGAALVLAICIVVKKRKHAANNAAG